MCFYTMVGHRVSFVGSTSENKVLIGPNCKKKSVTHILDRQVGIIMRS